MAQYLEQAVFAKQLSQFVLEVSSNNIESEGAIALFKAMTVCTNLTLLTFDISFNYA